MDDDICSHGRPNHQDQIRELREAAGLFVGAMPITPKAAWEEAITEVKRLRAASAMPEPLFNGIVEWSVPDFPGTVHIINAIGEAPHGGQRVVAYAVAESMTPEDERCPECHVVIAGAADPERMGEHVRINHPWRAATGSATPTQENDDE